MAPSTAAKISFRLGMGYPEKLEQLAQSLGCTHHQAARTLVVTALEQPNATQLTYDLHQTTTTLTLMADQIQQLHQDVLDLQLSVVTLVELLLTQQLDLSDPEREQLMQELFPTRPP